MFIQFYQIRLILIIIIHFLVAWLVQIVFRIASILLCRLFIQILFIIYWLFIFYLLLLFYNICYFDRNSFAFENSAFISIHSFNNHIPHTKPMFINHLIILIYKSLHFLLPLLSIILLHNLFSYFLQNSSHFQLQIDLFEVPFIILFQKLQKLVLNKSKPILQLLVARVRYFALQIPKEIRR